MEFQKFNKILSKHVKNLTKNEKHLFVVDVSAEDLWNKYLDSFPAGMNEVFRERREFDCSCCRHFIRDFGNVVKIKNNELVSVWDFQVGDPDYQVVVDALSAFVKAAPVRDAFVPFQSSFGTLKNVEVEDGKAHTWHHFHAKVSDSVEIFQKSERATVRGKLRDSRNVLERSFNEISLDSLNTVLELIAQKSLYKGEEWQKPLKKFHTMHKEYSQLSEGKKGNFCWITSLNAGPAISRIKNHSIGVLLTDITSGMDLDEAVRRYERIVAPNNYKRSKPIISKAMIKRAQKTVKELGYEDSLARRHAKLSDITINNILWANKDVARKMAGDVFDELSASVPDKPKKLDRIDEVPIELFVKDILPQLTELEVLLENRHIPNMMSLIAPKNAESKSMFKWANGFSWSYSGNITDSMKERVKAAGGKVDGDLRFSIQWNDNGDNHDDLDAHCHEPRGGHHIHFSSKLSSKTDGRLDVDIIRPQGVAVENITWPNRKKMLQGKHLFLVHNYTSRNAQSGFTAEIEFDGEIHSFSYPNPLRRGQKVEVANVILKGEEFTIEPLLKSEQSPREEWNLTTQKFHSVSACMYSPNYWDDNHGIGHRHYFFIVKDCKNDEKPYGFFNEFLDDKLREHRKVFEVLGSKMRAEESEEQLSGLGFSSTKPNSLVVRAKGSFTRVLRILF